MVSVEKKILNSNLLIFKFENYNLSYPKEIEEFLKFSTNKGKFKEFETLTTMGKSSYEKIYIIGLGLTEEFNTSVLFKSLGLALKNIRESIESLDILDNFNDDFGFTIGESISLSLYKFKGFKNDFSPVKLEKINVISSCRESIERGLISGESINFSREITNLPSNIVTPKYLAQKSQAIATENSLDITIYDKYMLEKLGMNSIINVGNGSCHEPYLIILQYLGDPDSKEITALVGKGITFDSGGLSLKPSKGMHGMVGDMAGAASVLGVMKAIGKLKPKKNVIALIPTAENMPSSKAYKPGDVIKSYSGKTIQIISTDAEGRLILCDAITYAKELGATTIIDVATLTGSCANFLGSINIGLFSNSNKLAEKLISSGKETGEYLWRLPNNDEYIEQLKTPSADLKNSGDSCGAIVASMFLQCFAEDVNFAHLDIAGCSSAREYSDVYEKGSNGKPARTLINYLIK
ncbi:M17 family metallopeptidase [Haloimpatiens lingqiaonensis]|uniref:M17 family metallopeptidase n=1 Tax=Haloimpatiens lingqiaonensis TaxID=1380675 RepID=UPI0010FEF85C|nr:leucyl aminopeptidase [Haloimpatiens lingqiaonensis]